MGEMLNSPSKLTAPWPAAPGNAATIIMVCTADKVVSGSSSGVTKAVNVPGGPSLIDAIELVWLENDQASAANGVRVYAKKSNGAWREVDVKNSAGAATIGAAAAKQAPVLASPAEYRLMIDVARYPYGVAIEYTAGATGPTSGASTWDGLITLHQRAEAIQR